jgi:3-oxoadipate enol-lactonase
MGLLYYVPLTRTWLGRLTGSFELNSHRAGTTADARLNGIFVHYEVSGPSDAPWVVLSNSLMTNFHMWDLQMEALRDYRILRYDQRGHGGTEGTEGEYTFELLAEDAMALMDYVGAERVHWVGLSMGGMTGQAIALNQPDRIRSLALCDTRGHSPEGRKEMRQNRIARVQQEGVGPMVEGAIRGFFSEAYVQANPVSIKWMREIIGRTSQVGVIGCSHALSAHNYSPRLHEILVPTIIIVGECDEGTPVSESQDMLGRIPDARMLVLPQAKHLSNMECAEEFNAALLDFLNEVEA